MKNLINFNFNKQEKKIQKFYSKKHVCFSINSPPLISPEEQIKAVTPIKSLTCVIISLIQTFTTVFNTY